MHIKGNVLVLVENDIYQYRTESTYRDFPTWEQTASRVLYCFASCDDKCLDRMEKISSQITHNASRGYTNNQSTYMTLPWFLVFSYRDGSRSRPESSY